MVYNLSELWYNSSMNLTDKKCNCDLDKCSSAEEHYDTCSCVIVFGESCVTCKEYEKEVANEDTTEGYSGDFHPTVVLDECKELMEKKNRDYQNPNSTVRQADYYPNGILTIHDICHAKMLRIKSVMAAMKAGGEPNNESLEDSFKDLINYATFAVSYLRGEIGWTEF